jgi:sodium/potassium/calcium exchanger 6
MRRRSISNPPLPMTAVAVTAKPPAIVVAPVEETEPAEEPVLMFPPAPASINAEEDAVRQGIKPTKAPPKSQRLALPTPRTPPPPPLPLPSQTAAVFAAPSLVTVVHPATLEAGASVAGVSAHAAIGMHRRYDGLHELQHKQWRMMRHGLAKIVQDWRQSPVDIEHIEKDSAKSSSGSLLERYKEFVEWDEKGLFGKIVHCAMLPFSTLMHLTVPHADDDGYNKWLLAISVTLSPIVGFFAMGQHDLMIGGVVPLFVIVTAAMALPGLAIAVFAPKKGLPRPLQFTIIIYSFIISMLWMYLVAQEAVSLLQSLSVMFNFSPTIMGLTVLSWGNCIGDFVADLTVTRQGYPDMAIAATYAGPLFNMLIGLGIGTTLLCVRKGIAYTIVLDDLMLIDFGYLFVALAFSLVFIAARKFVVDKTMGLVLLIGYLVFLTLSFLVEFGVFHILPR